MKNTILFCFILVLNSSYKSSEKTAKNIVASESTSVAKNQPPEVGNKINPGIDTTKKRQKLGATGYSILLSGEYTFLVEDSKFTIQFDNDKSSGKLVLDFYSPEINPEKKVPGSRPVINTFPDTICGTACRVDYYSAYALSIMQADIVKDYRIRFLIVTQNKDGSRPELVERDKLYAIMKSLQKDK